MNREDFAILFDKLRTLHEQASSAALARDPEWEISNPMFVLGVKIDDDEPPDSCWRGSWRGALRC
jgi:hypothetical protein